MIRLINCLRAKPGVSPEQFKQYWDSPAFGDLIKKMTHILGATHCHKRLTLKVPHNDWIALMRGTQGDPYDATIEYWFKNQQPFDDAWGTDELMNIGRDMLAYQSQFIDQQKSVAFFTEG